jgi:SAM-dependent methyltransferase
MPERALAAYYDDLARFTRLARRNAGLSVHRRLRGPDGVASAQVVHDRLLAALRPARGARLLDAGCGLGGTCFDWHARVGGDTVGLTVSPAQVARAGAEAARRGIAGSCRFQLMSYDADLRGLGTFDAVIAIESLAHAADPASTVANLARALRPGGRLAVVDDMPAASLAADDADLAAFRAGWHCPSLAGAEEMRAIIARAGLAVVHDEDLSPLVPQRAPRQLARLLRLNRWLRVLPVRAMRRVLDGHHGGLMLERLYRRGLMHYRLIVAAACAPAACG